MSNTKAPDVHKETERTVYACMETGAFEQAGVIMQEYEAQYPNEYEALRLKLVRDYGKEV